MVFILCCHIVTKYNVLHLVREEIVKDKEVETYFKELGFTNPIHDIVDKSIIQEITGLCMEAVSQVKKPIN